MRFMSRTSARPSVVGRLFDSPLTFALASALLGSLLALCVVGEPVVSHPVAVGVAVPLVVVLVGSLLLCQTANVHPGVVSQLRAVANQGTSDRDDPTSLCQSLQPLKQRGVVAAGWNRLLQRIEDCELTESLEQRLKSALEGSGGGRLATAFHSLPDGMVITSNSGCIESSNPSFNTALGIASDHLLVGSCIHELFQQWAAEGTNPVLQQLAQSNCKIHCELYKGSEIVDGVLRVSRAPLVDSHTHQPVDGLVWSVRDITQQRLSEEMRNQFVFTATHELRTPLTNIKAYAETLAMSDIDVEQQKGFYNTINTEATRLARFIDELLNVSQMEMGAISIARHETDVERVLREVVENVQPQIKQKSIQFDCDLPPKLPKMRLDKDKFTAAIINLLSNAVKYTADGGEVRLAVQVDTQQVHFHVEDNGVGINPDELDRIGEKFFRSRDERVQDVPGSGLGVAFVQEVARLHGGKLSVKSNWNEGSHFTLSLPTETERG